MRGISFLIGLVAAALLAGAAASQSQDKREMLPEAPGKDAVVRTCTACHDLSEITMTSRKSKDQWDVLVSKMSGLGAEVADADRPVIIDYLALNFGPAPAAPKDPAPALSPQAPAPPQP
jgi:competence protein ComEA